ncbi:MAG: PHB depolymerase family esterase [Candidatus Eremiobacterota bacterium]
MQSKKKRILFLVLALTLGLAGLSVARRLDLEDRSITVDGRERTYHVKIPSPMPPGKLPLVIVLHGGGGNGRQMARFAGFSDLADERGFFAVYPDAYERNWNDGRQDVDAAAFRENVDDLAFLTAMLDSLLKEHPIDPARVYATGPSNGGIMSHYLAANRADRIAAIAPVIGGIADPFCDRFAPSRPVPVLIVQGTEDPLVPYDGGAVSLGKRQRGKVVSTDRTVSLWKGVNGCFGEPEVSQVEDRDPSDGCSVTRYAWKGTGADVELYRVDGGGHTWPGGRQYLPVGMIGRVCRDFNATEVIWEFFSRSRSTAIE